MWVGTVWACVLIFVWLRGKIHAVEWCYEVVWSCEVRFSTSSQPDKNLCVCVLTRVAQIVTTACALVTLHDIRWDRMEIQMFFRAFPRSQTISASIPPLDNLPLSRMGYFTVVHSGFPCPTLHPDQLSIIADVLLVVCLSLIAYCLWVWRTLHIRGVEQCLIIVPLFLDRITLTVASTCLYVTCVICRKCHKLPKKCTMKFGCTFLYDAA